MVVDGILLRQILKCSMTFIKTGGEKVTLRLNFTCLIQFVPV